MKNKTKLVLTRKLTMYILATMKDLEPTAYAAHEKVRRMWYELTPKRRMICLITTSKVIAERWANDLV